MTTCSMTGAERRCGATDGVLTIRKAAGWTSHDVVAKIRHILGGVKVGHGGTLDPAATGVLPILIGRGTRIAEYLIRWEKEYRAVLRLGVTTDTQDATGIVVARHDASAVTDRAICETVERFRGTIQQVPPMYSAVKIGGTPLYKSARAGKTVEREARTVVIHALDVLTVDGTDVTLRILCSKGTYVRTLCADLGSALGVGGHLLSLERRRVGPLTVDAAMTVEEAAAHHALGRLSDYLMPMDHALQDLPCVEVDGPTSNRVRHGSPVPFSCLRWLKPSTESGTAVRIRDTEARLLAIGRYLGERHSVVTVEKVLIGQDMKDI
ncbi:MAG TPA: tRNA pseudouridine(55) synthase TruB [Nitrospira sp.]|nr:tRNA pseudouridine(55) synthase TruB [Nitrospira sp.]